MTTTQESNGTALAVREFTDSQLQQRMKANINARFGLHEATPPQLNIIFLLAKRWGLDPVNEITLYEGRPFITLDGRLQLMRRNPDYRGYRTRPLNRTEREDWGYEPEDVVVEATVLTHAHGEITERGCVRRAEIDGARARARDSGKRAAPVGIYGPEIAEKRAIARASRAAFGQDVPDEDEVGYLIEERNDPVRLKALAAQYTDVHGSDDAGTAFADLPLAEPQETPDAETAPMVTTKRHPLWAAYTAAYAQAQGDGLEDLPDITLPVAEEVLKASTASLVELVEQKRSQAF